MPSRPHASKRHTAQRIFQRLGGEHGYGGKYDQVRRYVGNAMLQKGV